MPDRIDPARLVEHVPVVGIRLAILRILVARFGRDVPTPTIVERAWAGAADGGPLTAIDSVRVHTFQLRKRLAPYGLTTLGQQGRERACTG